MLKYVLIVLVLLVAKPVFADCEWGTGCYTPPIQSPQCHTIFVLGSGYQVVCQ